MAHPHSRASDGFSHVQYIHGARDRAISEGEHDQWSTDVIPHSAATDQSATSSGSDYEAQETIQSWNDFCTDFLTTQASEGEPANAFTELTGWTHGEHQEQFATHWDLMRDLFLADQLTMPTSEDNDNMFRGSGPGSAYDPQSQALPVVGDPDWPTTPVPLPSTSKGPCHTRSSGQNELGSSGYLHVPDDVSSSRHMTDNTPVCSDTESGDQFDDRFPGPSDRPFLTATYNDNQSQWAPPLLPPSMWAAQIPSYPPSSPHYQLPSESSVGASTAQSYNTYQRNASTHFHSHGTVLGPPYDSAGTNQDTHSLTFIQWTPEDAGYLQRSTPRKKRTHQPKRSTQPKKTTHEVNRYRLRMRSRWCKSCQEDGDPHQYVCSGQVTNDIMGECGVCAKKAHGTNTQPTCSLWRKSHRQHIALGDHPSLLEPQTSRYEAAKPQNCDSWPLQ